MKISDTFCQFQTSIVQKSQIGFSQQSGIVGIIFGVRTGHLSVHADNFLDLIGVCRSKDETILMLSAWYTA